MTVQMVERRTTISKDEGLINLANLLIRQMAYLNKTRQVVIKMLLQKQQSKCVGVT